jgi:3-methyl-2-oxobutanoate hydroxymethyltransferase
MNVLDFKKMKHEKRPLTMVTCYDAWSAKIIEQSEIDLVLVGDSCAMVMHGHMSTLAATPEMMAFHTSAVARGLGPQTKKFLIADIPFPWNRKGIPAAMDCVDTLMKAGAHAVKLEGFDGHEDVISAIVGSGIPVMGHIGLTPQSVHQLGGFRVQGRDDRVAENLIKQAKGLEALGACSIVLEAVPSHLAARITSELSIPTIGIGAGASCDGQVLVLHDMLGMNIDFKPKFVRTFTNGKEGVLQALNQYHHAVLEHTFPNEQESYS